MAVLVGALELLPALHHGVDARRRVEARLPDGFQSVSSLGRKLLERYPRRNALPMSHENKRQPYCTATLRISRCEVLRAVSSHPCCLSMKPRMTSLALIILQPTMSFQRGTHSPVMTLRP